MDSDIWLPLATLVGGWGLAQIGDLLKDRRTSDWERLARRFELQRSTLLNLQDALLELSTAAEAARQADRLAKMGRSRWEQQENVCLGREAALMESQDCRMDALLACRGRGGSVAR
jgi:hypothetical protein